MHLTRTLTLCAAAALAVASCKKDDDNSANNGNNGGSGNTLPAAQTFIIGDKTFQETYDTAWRQDDSTYICVFYSQQNVDPKGFLTFYFGSQGAPAAGAYKVVSSTKPKAGQVFCGANLTFPSTRTGEDYYPADTTTTNLTVSVVNGKLSLAMPPIQSATKSGASKQAKVSANVTRTK